MATAQDYVQQAVRAGHAGVEDAHAGGTEGRPCDALRVVDTMLEMHRTLLVSHRDEMRVAAGALSGRTCRRSGSASATQGRSVHLSMFVTVLETLLAMLATLCLLLDLLLSLLLSLLMSL